MASLLNLSHAPGRAALCSGSADSQAGDRGKVTDSSAVVPTSSRFYLFLFARIALVFESDLVDPWSVGYDRVTRVAMGGWLSVC